MSFLLWVGTWLYLYIPITSVIPTFSLLETMLLTSIHFCASKFSILLDRSWKEETFSHKVTVFCHANSYGIAFTAAALYSHLGFRGAWFLHILSNTDYSLTFEPPYSGVSEYLLWSVFWDSVLSLQRTPCFPAHLATELWPTWLSMFLHLFSCMLYVLTKQVLPRSFAYFKLGCLFISLQKFFMYSRYKFFIWYLILK